MTVRFYGVAGMSPELRASTLESIKNGALEVVERWKPLIEKRKCYWLTVGAYRQIVCKEPSGEVKYLFEACFQEEMEASGVNREPEKYNTVEEICGALDIKSEAVYNTLISVCMNICSCEETCAPVREALLASCGMAEERIVNTESD